MKRDTEIQRGTERYKIRYKERYKEIYKERYKERYKEVHRSTHSEVDAGDSIEDDEDVGISEFFEAEVQASCGGGRRLIGGKMVN